MAVVGLADPLQLMTKKPLRIENVRIRWRIVFSSDSTLSLNSAADRMRAFSRIQVEPQRRFFVVEIWSMRRNEDSVGKAGEVASAG